MNKVLLIILVFSSHIAGASSSFNWVLDKEIIDSNKFAHDKRSKLILKAIVPDLKVKRNAKPDLLGVVWVDLVFPGKKQVLNNRYVTFYGARPHDVKTKGFVWIDTKTKTGLFAITDCLSPGLETDCIHIGSNFYNFKSLPKKAINALEKWREDNSLGQYSSYFVDKSKKITNVNLSKASKDSGP